MLLVEFRPPRPLGEEGLLGLLELVWLWLEEQAWTVVSLGLASFLAGEEVSAVEVVESVVLASGSSRWKPLVLELDAGARKLVSVAVG